VYLTLNLIKFEHNNICFFFTCRRLLTQLDSYQPEDKKSKEYPKKGGTAAASDCVTYELYYRQEQAQFSKNARVKLLPRSI